MFKIIWENPIDDDFATTLIVWYISDWISEICQMSFAYFFHTL